MKRFEWFDPSPIESFNLGLDVESVQPLASALAGFLALTDLAFYGNPIGPDGATHFANIVQFGKCQNLSNLNLAMCDIGERGGRAMADAMVTRRPLSLFIGAYRCS